MATEILLFLIKSAWAWLPIGIIGLIGAVMERKAEHGKD